MLGGLVLAIMATSAGTPAPPTTAQVEVRRVEVSFAFSGRDVFLFGQTPPGTRRVMAVMEGASAGPVRLMEKGRVAIFWLGVRQYRLGGVPGVYLVNLSCPTCNGLAICHHDGALDTCDRLLGSGRPTVGAAEIGTRATLACLSGTLAIGEAKRVLDGFWSLQEQRGLYGVRQNAIRVGSSGAFYHEFALPASAPDGRYRITTYFFSDEGLLAVRENELVVRKTGLVSWFSRLAERHALAYGALAVALAVAAGWLAGTLFKRSAH